MYFDWFKYHNKIIEKRVVFLVLNKKIGFSLAKITHLSNKSSLDLRDFIN